MQGLVKVLDTFQDVLLPRTYWLSGRAGRELITLEVMTDGPNVVLYVIVITWNFFTCRKSSPLKLSLVKVEGQYPIWRLPRQANMMPLAVVCFDTGPFPVKYTIIYQENGKCYLEAGRNFPTNILGYVILLFHRFVVNLRWINALEYHSSTNYWYEDLMHSYIILACTSELTTGGHKRNRASFSASYPFIPVFTSSSGNFEQMNGHLNLVIYLSSYWLMPKNYNCKYRKWQVGKRI